MNLVEVFEKVMEKPRNIIITLPKSISWEDYQTELKKVEDFSETMSFKVPHLPKGNIEKCYIVHNGQIKGWMKVTNIIDNLEFTCTTTGQTWSGKFIQRSGPFHYLENEVPYKGFQSWRYFDENLLNVENN